MYRKIKILYLDSKFEEFVSEKETNLFFNILKKEYPEEYSKVCNKEEEDIIKLAEEKYPKEMEDIKIQKAKEKKIIEYGKTWGMNMQYYDNVNEVIDELNKYDVMLKQPKKNIFNDLKTLSAQNIKNGCESITFRLNNKYFSKKIDLYCDDYKHFLTESVNLYNKFLNTHEQSNIFNENDCVLYNEKPEYANNHFCGTVSKTALPKHKTVKISTRYNGEKRIKKLNKKGTINIYTWKLK